MLSVLFKLDQTIGQEAGGIQLVVLAEIIDGDALKDHAGDLIGRGGEEHRDLRVSSAADDVAAAQVLGEVPEKALHQGIHMQRMERGRAGGAEHDQAEIELAVAAVQHAEHQTGHVLQHAAVTDEGMIAGHAAKLALQLRDAVIQRPAGVDHLALVYDGRVYLYMTGDVLEYDKYGEVKDNSYALINTLNVVSSADLGTTGYIQLRQDSPKGGVIGYVIITPTGEGYHDITAELTQPVEGVHDLVMIFSGEGYSLDAWQFSAE